MRLKSISFVIMMLMMNGCANHITPPADFWGSVGFAYETQNDSATGHIHSSSTATVIGFEKQLGGGLGIGGEVGG